jgi:hypothetical protein
MEERKGGGQREGNWCEEMEMRGREGGLGGDIRMNGREG